MPICYYCNREILNGTKLLDNGIKYICKNEDDIKVCNEIRRNQENEKKQSEYIQSQLNIKQSGGTQINCSCGTSFYTLFPLETFPPMDNCPHCEATHSQKIK